MHPNVKGAMDALHPAFEALMACAPYRTGAAVPERGVYLFTEAGAHMYVGRSNRLQTRRGEHCRPGSPFNQASFAMLIARKHTGLHRKSVDKITRDGLLDNAEFMTRFSEAKARIRLMEFRYVEETDQTRQALLEIYAATALQAPFNDFETH